MARFLIEHTGENRKTRRAATANWAPPVENRFAGAKESGDISEVGHEMQHERMPTRRELWKQRARNRLGKLDLELRALQRLALYGRGGGKSKALAEEQVLSKMADAWAQNPVAFELELARRYPADLAQKIALECQRRKANP